MNFVVLIQILLFFSVLFVISDAKQEKKQKIAIIGGGIGGAFLQIQLRQIFGENAEISVFEKQDRLGGRCMSFQYEGKYYELGKQRFTDYDKLFLDYVKTVNMTISKSSSTTLGIYNEEGYVFLLNTFFLFKPITFLFNFPVSSSSYMFAYNSNWEKINRIYDQIDQNQYQNFRQLLQACSLDDMLDYAFDEYVQSESYYLIRKSFTNSFLRSISVLVLDQKENINALAGFQSQFTGSGQIRNMEEGLEQFVNKLFNIKLDIKSQIKINLNTNVNFIEKLHPINDSDYQFRLHFNETFQDFDQVVIAFPLEQNENPNLFFKNFSENQSIFQQNLKSGYYSNYVITYVKAINPLYSYFGFNITDNYPELMVPYDQDKSEFYKILKVCNKCLQDRSSLFQITSKQKLNQAQINNIFGESSKIIKQKEWDALIPNVKNYETNEIADYQLLNGLYYLHSAEQAVPFLAFEAISAKIVSNLMNPSFQNKKTQQQTSDL
ncbi:prenylcysteine oxidase (macronuclear) [Tetrahymena thermophila SB210]|uniref:Prenylcysteine oxidase n=1 Tax=Tetrahymena thermophila (strain SB210) TaxID=312017 RepID=Q22W85_TETTS|nr:prenylcysteine oxidase [Tetrahymena thermophila SB210]EAR89532.2 prenylcysteine oxidase [Tetrahymena thermophila SB210]|eukprot:XP_001009777.2 prenylcysteine oxidase [Tetrahymena thermophila SB210]